jgi:WD40 repeat protein
MSALKVFLGHTSRLACLPNERSFVQAALDAIAASGRLSHDMRHFTADDRSPAQLCIDTVRQCDVYVGLFGLDYGSPVRDRPEVSYTELEFLTALEELKARGMRVFAFLLDETAGAAFGPLDPRQASFRQRVLDSGIVTATFATPGDLQYRLHLALEKLPAAPSPDRRLQHLPYLPANFTGRGADLDAAEQLVRTALAGGATLSFVGFRGMGGIGKTALAAALAERLAADGRTFPCGVLWANLLDKAPEDVAREWVRDLGGDVSGLGPEQCLSRFHELAAARRPLVVLDNVPRGGGGDGPAARLLVRARGVATLLTTRFREAVPAGVPVREVEALPPGEAAHLLRTHAGAAVDEDRAAAEAVLGQCGRLPLFVNAAGRAVANGYYSLAEYAEELRRRGLSALADEDEKAAAVFDLSWRFVSEPAREVFAALALAPGGDVGPNLVTAWLRQGGGDGKQAARLLADLANAALLIPTDEGARRYRYHDRVRDFALARLALPREEVQRRLKACYTDWDMVRAEFGAVGAFALAGQYHHLHGWGGAVPKDFAPWYHFVRGQVSVLGEYPDLFFQQAFNEPIESPVSQAARQRSGGPEAPARWLEWLNRPRKFVPPACLQVLLGHSFAVSGVAVSTDARVAVSGAWDKTLRVWDLATGQCRAILEGHEECVESVALSADSGTAVSGSRDGELRVWDVATARCRTVLARDLGWIFGVAVSADGRTAVSGAGKRTAQVWDLTAGQRSATLQGHTSRVRSVAVTADGRTAVTGAEDRSLRVWDTAGGHCRAALTGHAAPVTCVALTGDGRVAVSGGLDRTLCVWDLTSGQCRTTLAGHGGQIVSVAVSADGRTAVSTDGDRTARVWDLDTGQCRTTFEGHTGRLSCVAISADSSLAISGAFDHTVRVWDVNAGLNHVPAEGHGDWLRGVAVSADGLTAISEGTYDGLVRVWDLATGQCRAVHPANSTAALGAWKSITADGPLTTRRRGQYLEVSCAQDREVVARFPRNCYRSASSSDGRHVIAGDLAGRIFLLRLRHRED